MKLSEVFAQLAYGELAQMGFVNSTLDGINPTKYAQMTGHVNLGLTALFRRFNLKEGRLTIALSPNKFTYPLSSLSSTVFVPMAGIAGFKDDIHKIERVYTDSDFELALNNEADEWSCFTPNLTTLVVPQEIVNRERDIPDELKTSNLKVVYRANHPHIDYVGTTFDPTTIELELPPSHLEPLLYFIASRINNPIGMTAEFHAGNSYAAKYEKACQELEMHNIRVDRGGQNTRLIRNGWV